MGNIEETYSWILIFVLFFLTRTKYQAVKNLVKVKVEEFSAEKNSVKNFSPHKFFFLIRIWDSPNFLQTIFLGDDSERTRFLAVRMLTIISWKNFGQILKFFVLYSLWNCYFRQRHFSFELIDVDLCWVISILLHHWLQQLFTMSIILAGQMHFFAIVATNWLSFITTQPFWKTIMSPNHSNWPWTTLIMQIYLGNIY